MPTRLQWWRDRITSHKVVWGLVVLTALAAVALLWTFTASTTVFYLGSGIIRLPPVF